MKPLLPTASSVHRAMACPASCALPSTEDEIGSDAQSKGTAIHKFIADSIIFTRDGALERIDHKYRDECAKIDLKTLSNELGCVDDVCPEEAFSWNIKTGKFLRLGYLSDRSYGDLDAHETAGTADIYAELPSKTPVIVDVKTGKKVAPAADNWQLRALAVMACGVTGHMEARAAIAYLKPSGKWTFDWAHYSAWDLDIYEDELRQMSTRVHMAHLAFSDGRNPEVNPSDDACRYCRCKLSCPAWTEIKEIGNG